MKIKLNGQNVDITLDSEKTVGEVLAAMEKWLADSGHRLSGLAIDGKTINASALEEAFSTGVEFVKTIDVFTNSLTELSVQSLVQIYRDIDEYEAASFENRQIFFESWKLSPQSGLAAEENPDIYALCLRAFSGEIELHILRAIVEERLREIENPGAELVALEKLANEASIRLEEFPVDIQTGKDVRAAETIQIFVNIAEKLFRIFNILGAQGFPLETIKVGETGISDYVTEFNSVIKEMLDAYEAQDTVLIGDIAEYELAPRLRGLVSALSRAAVEKSRVTQA